MCWPLMQFSLLNFEKFTFLGIEMLLKVWLFIVVPQMSFLKNNSMMEDPSVWSLPPPFGKQDLTFVLPHRVV